MKALPTIRTRRLQLGLLFFLLGSFLTLRASAQSSADDVGKGSGHILLVLPFDSVTATAAGSPGTPTGLDWLGEAAPEVLNSRFTSAGFLPLTREDRLYALDHLGLPENFQPSRATALRIAQTLDADSILIGSYSVTTVGTATKLTLRARIVDVAKLRLSDEVSTSDDLAQLIPLLNSLAWQLTRKLDPTFSVAEETFRSADARLRLDGFEQYIRGLTERQTDERLRHLKKATELSPDFTPGWLALGKLQFATQQFEQAAVSFGKVTAKSGGNSGDPSALEAGFYRGLSLIFSGSYARAEEAFATVARLLPLPEVVNNQAVAISRRGHDSVALFRQAVAADPTDPDYHFNLAVALHRHGDRADALTEVAQTIKLHPIDSEAKATEANWKAAPAAATAETPSEPLERIKRSYDGAAFRQAALMMDQVEAAHLATLKAPERAARLNRSAHEKLDRGLLLEAERGYQAALAADDHSAEAHSGLAQVRERAGDTEGARKEAHAALDRQVAGSQNVEAYLVLARLDLAAGNLPTARESVDQALRSDPNSRVAKDLRKTIDTRQQAAPSIEAKAPAKP